MSAGKRYVLDANVFIQAHRLYYAFDICPGFWSALIRQHRIRQLCSVDRIKSELLGEDVPLASWIRKSTPDDIFKGTSDRRVVEAFGKMVNWVQTEDQFVGQAKAEFASAADGWLIAFAKVNGMIVVTHERYAPEAKSSVKIPNVCLEFEVPFCNTFEMLRGLGEQFVRKARQKGR